MGCAGSRPQPTEGDAAVGGAGSVESIIGTEQAVTLGAFANAAALEKALCEHKIDVAAWDRNGAKGVTQLLSELENGESVLNVESGRVTRCLRVVKMRIRRPGSDQVLIEVKQVMPSGEERLRGDVPGEKMLADEEPAAAALRGVKEELGERLQSEPRVLGVLHETTEVKPSPSYPGLRCCYTSYEVDIEVADLPEGAFTTTETNGDKVQVHHWDWRQ